MWSTGEEDGKPLQYSCLENPMNSMKRQKDMTLEEVPGQQVPNMLLERGEITPEGMKRLSQSVNNSQVWMCLVVKSKVQCCREQYCIGTWNVRSMNQGKLKVVKQERARVNIVILGNGQEWVNLIQMTTVSTTVGRNHFGEIE